ncbi:MAG: hypothetical protein PHG98_04550 [Bacteroidales bacterium]|nr:hypothetical protein [Bacteroidales bacterium]
MKIKSLIAVLAILFSVNLFAVPADKTPITIKQPNGKTLTFILQGDERINWAITLDEYSLLTNKNGNWVYAVLDKNGDMIPSDVLACNKEERSKDELTFLENVKPNLFFSKKQIDIRLNREKKEFDNQAKKAIQPEKDKNKKCCSWFRKKSK